MTVQEEILVCLWGRYEALNPYGTEQGGCCVRLTKGEEEEGKGTRNLGDGRFKYPGSQDSAAAADKNSPPTAFEGSNPNDPMWDKGTINITTRRNTT